MTAYFFIHRSGWDALHCYDRSEAIILALKGGYLALEEGAGKRSGSRGGWIGR